MLISIISDVDMIKWTIDEKVKYFDVNDDLCHFDDALTFPLISRKIK